LAFGIVFIIFVAGQKTSMKSNELHKLIKKNGWKHVRTSGSHYVYEKDGVTYPVPYHGSKEVKKGLELATKKKLKL